VNQISAVFCRDHSIGTPILRAAMWSPWSHVAPIIEDEPDCIIDATLFRGVQRRSKSGLLLHASKCEIRHFDCPSPQAAYDFARSQIGKRYDYAGVVGIGLRRDWQQDDAWFCSELFEAMLAAGGNPRFVRNAGRVTVQHSWMVR
jgi:uncharacterized protein YycO